MPDWTRRRLLRSLLYGFGATAFVPIALRSTQPAGSGPLRDWLREWLPDTAAARAIGDAYLADNPDAAQRTRALARLLRRQPDAAACRALLHDRRSRDLRADDIVVIDGWVLAATEAQLCALARKSV